MCQQLCTQFKRGYSYGRSVLLAGPPPLCLLSILADLDNNLASRPLGGIQESSKAWGHKPQSLQS